MQSYSGERGSAAICSFNSKIKEGSDKEVFRVSVVTARSAHQMRGLMKHLRVGTTHLACLGILGISDTSGLTPALPPAGSPVTISARDAMAKADFHSLTIAGAPSAAPQSAVVDKVSASGDEIRLERRGGTYLVPVAINGTITLKFVLDSGASDVLIPADVFLTLLRTGTVSERDILGSQIYSLADGSTLKGTRFLIRELRVGNHVINDVVASVGPVTGDLLLGLSFLSRFGTVTLNNQEQIGRAHV